MGKKLGSVIFHLMLFGLQKDVLGNESLSKNETLKEQNAPKSTK